MFVSDTQLQNRSLNSKTTLNICDLNERLVLKVVINIYRSFLQLSEWQPCVPVDLRMRANFGAGAEYGSVGVPTYI